MPLLINVNCKYATVISDTLYFFKCLKIKKTFKFLWWSWDYYKDCDYTMNEDMCPFREPMIAINPNEKR